MNKYFIFTIILIATITNCGTKIKRAAANRQKTKTDNSKTKTTKPNHTEPQFNISTQKWTGLNKIVTTRLADKKKIIFESSIKIFKNSIPSSEQTLKVSAWSRPSSVINDILKQQFNNFSTLVSAKNKYYDYEKIDNCKTFFVDFANRFLGGGWKGRGWVQEEIMFAEIPQLADYQLGGQFKKTRSGSASVGSGSPQPIIFENAKRIIFYNTKYFDTYGRKLNKASFKNIKKSIHILRQPQTVNILAIAAPKISYEEDNKSKQLLKDLFNTAYSGFKLAKKISNTNNTAIATGKLGAGAFGNDPIVVNVIQQLAAKHAQINKIIFYDYDNNTQKKASAIVENILTEVDKNTNISNLIEITQQNI